jgi:hypothetical protein
VGFTVPFILALRSGKRFPTVGSVLFFVLGCMRDGKSYVEKIVEFPVGG